MTKAATVEVFTTDDEDKEIRQVKESRREKKRRLSTIDGDKPNGRKLPRLAGGDAGKVFSCTEPGCDKKFKTVSQLLCQPRPSALTRVTELCPAEPYQSGASIRAEACLSSPWMRSSIRLCFQLAETSRSARSPAAVVDQRVCTCGGNHRLHWSDLCQALVRLSSTRA